MRGRLLRKREGRTGETVLGGFRRAVLIGKPDLALSFLERALRHAGNVEPVTGGMRNHGSGTCTDCNERISARRIAAIPGVSRCVSCQEDATFGRSR